MLRVASARTRGTSDNELNGEGSMRTSNGNSQTIGLTGSNREEDSTETAAQGVQDGGNVIDRLKDATGIPNSPQESGHWFRKGSVQFRADANVPTKVESPIGKTWPVLDRLIDAHAKKNPRRVIYTPLNVDGNFEPGDLMGVLPSGEQVLKAGFIYQSCGDSSETLSKRRMAITAKTIYLARANSGQVVDHIATADIVSCRILPPHHTEAAEVKIKHDVIMHDTSFDMATPDKNSLESGGLYLGSKGASLAVTKEAGVGAAQTRRKCYMTEQRDDAEIFQHGFQVHTTDTGMYTTLSYRFYADSREDRDAWVAEIDNCVRMYRMSLPTRNQLILERCQLVARALYMSDIVQFALAFLIFSNFMFNAAQAEVGKYLAPSIQTMLDNMDDIFTTLFALELVWNAFAHWFWLFIKDGWNIFDTIVVFISILSRLFDNVPGLNTLRLLRAFRVLRLFGRLASLRRIITALMMSIQPVLNAFLIMLLVVSIYSILAVEFFSEWVGPAPDYYPVGFHFFGTFSKAMFSNFQIITGDSWCSGIVRLFFDADGNLPYGPVAFFVSFIVIVGWTLLQVVVALLLDNFNTATQKEKNEAAALLAEEQGFEYEMRSLDPVLASLSHFETDHDLKDRICTLFEVIDHDDSEELGYEEMAYGLKKLKFKPPVELTLEEYEQFKGGRDGPLDVTYFETCMRRELKLYGQRQMANAMEMDRDSDLAPIMIVLKLLLNATANVASLDHKTIMASLRGQGCFADMIENQGMHQMLDSKVDVATPRKLDRPNRSASTTARSAVSRSDLDPVAKGDIRMVSSTADDPQRDALQLLQGYDKYAQGIHEKLDDLQFKVSSLTSNVATVMRRLDEDAASRMPDKLDRIVSLLLDMQSRMLNLEVMQTASTPPGGIASSIGFFTKSSREATTPKKDPTVFKQVSLSGNGTKRTSGMWSDLSGRQGVSNAQEAQVGPTGLGSLQEVDWGLDERGGGGGQEAKFYY